MNDKPQALDRTTSAIINTTIAITDFGFSDPNDASPPSSIPANSLQSVIVLTAPSAGTLLNGTTPITAFPATVPAGSLITLASGTAGPVSFTFQVVDNGGTASRRQQYVVAGQYAHDQCLERPASSRRSAAASAVTALEDTAYQFRPADIQFTDPNDPAEWSRQPGRHLCGHAPVAGQP